MAKTTFKTKDAFFTWATAKDWNIISYDQWQDSDSATLRVETWVAPSGRVLNVHYNDSDKVTHITQG